MTLRAGARVRLPSWRKGARRQPARVDRGPLLLGRIRRAVASRAPEFLRSDTEVTLSPLQRRFVSCNGARRAWRHEEDDRVVWCVADEESQRALLEWVLDGPGAVVPTAVEKTIVAECIERLLSGSAGSWTEADQHEIDDEEAWHGVLNLRGPSAAARLELHVRADAEAAVGAAPHVDDVPLSLEGRLAPFRVTIGDLAHLRQGSSLAMSIATTAPPALLCLTGGPAMSGTLGVVNGCRAIRLSGDLKRTPI